jgi:hypothetical protein
MYFERYALDVLVRGGSFRTCNLADGSRSTLELPVDCAVRRFSKLEELGGVADDIAYLPNAKTFAAIDGILPGRRLVNATISKAHTLLMRGKSDEGVGVVAIANALGIHGAVTFMWAVPEDRFDAVCKGGLRQSVHGKRGDPAVSQVVVCVPFAVTHSRRALSSSVPLT